MCIGREGGREYNAKRIIRIGSHIAKPKENIFPLYQVVPKNVCDVLFFLCRYVVVVDIDNVGVIAAAAAVVITLH